jgi:hypothetical protein
VDEDPPDFLRRLGHIFTTFGPGTQNSGNVSYGLVAGGRRFFVKTAGSVDDTTPYLGHPERVALLRHAVHLATTFHDPLLPPLLNVIESPAGPMLVYLWAEGDLLWSPQEERDLPNSALQRFRALPTVLISSLLGRLINLHAGFAAAGWVGSDFYDGCLIYDFSRRILTVVDLDSYRPGPLVNRMGRMFGSTRFMAPEEFHRGAVIDERTMVFTMGRTVLLLLSDGSVDCARFRGSEAQFEAAIHACANDPDERFQTVAEVNEAWQLTLASRATRG